MRADAPPVVRLIKAALPVAGAVALTPLLLFISTTNTLFIKNAVDFVHDVHVLDQFLTYSIYAFLLGSLFFLLARFLKPRLLSFPFWLYVLAGPVFLVYAFLHVRIPAAMDRLLVCGTFATVYFIAAGLLTWKGKVDTAIALFSRVFVIFFVIEAVIFVTNREARQVSFQEPAESPPLKVSATRKPNIYHIIFDAYGPNLFERTLTPEVRSQLSGFQFFPETIAPYPGTYISIPAMFSGSYYSLPASPAEFMNNAFDSEQSLLYWLNAAGYDTYAFLPFLISKGVRSGFRHVRMHSDYGEPGFAIDSRGEFRSLWLYAHFPSFLVKQFVSERAIHELKNPAGALPKALPIYSYASFKRFLREEESLPDHNRYTFLHVMLPHGPFVLRADGSFGPFLEDGSLPETSVMEQSYCATGLLLEFIHTLKRLDRFDKSLVLLHADHGAWNVTAPGQSKFIRRAHALLLLKLPGRNSSIPFEVNDAEVNLLDIPPTLLDAVDIDPGVPYVGMTLVHPEKIPHGRERRHGNYNPHIGSKWTERSLSYFTVRGKRFTNESKGNVFMESFLTPDEERYFNGQQPVSDIQNGGFEKFMTGWAGLAEAPKCESEKKVVKFGKTSLKLTSSSGDGRRAQKRITTLTAPPIEKLRGKEVSFGAWVHTPAPDMVTVQIIDSWKNYFGASPTKANEWQLVIRRAVIPKDAKQVLFAVTVSHDGKTPTVCYLDGAALVIHE